MAVILIVTTDAIQGLTVAAAGMPSSTIVSCGSNFGTDFKITFSEDANQWLSAVTDVTVGETSYTKGSTSYSVWKNTAFYVDASSNYILIGEGAVNDTADCVISAEGYTKLVLELNKSNYSVTIKESPGSEHTHSGGIATCQQKAVCTVCGEEYGELGDHTYENDKCTVCGLEKIDVPSVVADNSQSTYFILKVDGNDYVQGFSSISCNNEKLEETEYKIALNGTKYYRDKENNAICFDKMGGIPFKSGDIITIEHPGYKALRLKISVAAGEVSVKPVGQDVEQGDEYELHVRLVGYFESALVNQKGYDAISSASTNVTQNKNSDVSVEAALLTSGAEPTDDDWKLLNASGITIDTQNTKVNIDDSVGMAGVYSVYDSSVTLAGIPVKAGEYKISVTITDDQGRTATSNELTFKVYSGEENLEDQLILENCTQTADGKYMYDMEPWAIKNFNDTDNIVTVPIDIKAWYGSHTSGTYGELGYAISEGTDTTQTLIVPSNCNLTFVNMDILSSVRIVVEDGAALILRDSTVQGIIDVHKGGKFSMNYNEYGDTSEFLTGASINGQLILRDGATLENAKIYSNTNFIPNGTEVRKNTNPVVVAEGSVNISGQVFIRGDEAPTGTDSATDKSFAGQTGLLVQNGTLNITEGSVLAVYGGGYEATTSIGGAAVILDNAVITGQGKLIAVGGQGTFDNGGNAIEGNGTISVINAYLEGGNSYQPKEECTAGKAVTDSVILSGNTNRNLIDGKTIISESDNINTGTYWESITEIPDLSLYPVENNAPGEIPDKISVTSVALNKEVIELTKAGASESLTAVVLPENADNQNVTWDSDNTSVATVDTNGTITAVANGQAIITVTTEDGKFKASCTVTVNIPKPVHIHDKKLQEITAKDATCTEAGNKAYYICDSCGVWFSDENGIQVIEDHDSVIIPATGHTWKTEWSKDSKSHWHECVCGERKDVETHSGDTSCVVCGQKIAENKPENPTQNKKKIWKVTYKANTSAKVSGIPSDKTSYQDGKTVTVKGIPTRTSAFFAGWNTKADGSGKSYTKGKTFKITGNITLYAQWKTSYTTSTKLKYKVTGTKAVECIGTTDKKAKTIKIPKTITYKGITYKVTSVAKKAFYGNKKITSVSIGNNVKTIGNSAFFKCSNLKKITIGTGLTSIGQHVFCNTKKGCTITINSTKLKSVKTAINHGVKNMVVKVPKSKVNAYKKLFGKYSKTITVKAK